MFIAALLAMAPKLETPQMSIIGWMDKETMIYRYSVVLLSNEKETTDTHYSVIDLKIITPNERRPSPTKKKKKHCFHLLKNLGNAD